MNLGFVLLVLPTPLNVDSIPSDHIILKGLIVSILPMEPLGINRNHYNRRFLELSKIPNEKTK